MKNTVELFSLTKFLVALSWGGSSSGVLLGFFLTFGGEFLYPEARNNQSCFILKWHLLAFLKFRVVISFCAKTGFLTFSLFYLLFCLIAFFPSLLFWFLEKHTSVYESLDLFLEELPRLPPQRENDFEIELVSGAQPILKAPYWMAPIELKELMT